MAQPNTNEMTANVDKHGEIKAFCVMVRKKRAQFKCMEEFDCDPSQCRVLL